MMNHWGGNLSFLLFFFLSLLSSSGGGAGGGNVSFIILVDTFSRSRLV